MHNDEVVDLSVYMNKVWMSQMTESFDGMRVAAERELQTIKQMLLQMNILIWERQGSRRQRWIADTAEWLTRYLAAKGPASTRRLKMAWREKVTLNWRPFPELRCLAVEMGFVDGTAWLLPADHPMAGCRCG